MKKYLFAIFVMLFVLTLSFGQIIEARGRYGSVRIGGYSSNGKGSHYIGGYVRSCRGWACR